MLQNEGLDFNISTSASAFMSPALTSHSPSASIYTIFGSSTKVLHDIFFRLSNISVTSSATPGIVENYVVLLQFLTNDGATPGCEDKSIFLVNYLKVIPYPLSSGSITYLP
jgi:hypothetical protein